MKDLAERCRPLVMVRSRFVATAPVTVKDPYFNGEVRNFRRRLLRGPVKKIDIQNNVSHTSYPKQVSDDERIFASHQRKSKKANTAKDGENGSNVNKDNGAASAVNENEINPTNTKKEGSTTLTLAEDIGVLIDQSNEPI